MMRFLFMAYEAPVATCTVDYYKWMYFTLWTLLLVMMMLDCQLTYTALVSRLFHLVDTAPGDYDA
jgi:hypothetical protein